MAYGIKPGSQLQGQQKEHKFIFTMVPGSNGKLFRVRCKCMAEYRNVSDRYYNYDPLGDVSSLQDAKALYDRHLMESQ